MKWLVLYPDRLRYCSESIICHRKAFWEGSANEALGFVHHFLLPWHFCPFRQPDVRTTVVIYPCYDIQQEHTVVGLLVSHPSEVCQYLHTGGCGGSVFYRMHFLLLKKAVRLLALYSYSTQGMESTEIYVQLEILLSFLFTDYNSPLAFQSRVYFSPNSINQ